MTLGALSIVLAAIGDAAMAIRLVKMGLVLKLATLVRQFTQVPPPPLPPRHGSVSPRAASPPVDIAAAAAAFAEDEVSRGRRRETKQVWGGGGHGYVCFVTTICWVSCVCHIILASVFFAWFVRVYMVFCVCVVLAVVGFVWFVRFGHFCSSC